VGDSARHAQGAHPRGAFMGIIGREGPRADVSPPQPPRTGVIVTAAASLLPQSPARPRVRPNPPQNRPLRSTKRALRGSRAGNNDINQPQQRPAHLFIRSTARARSSAGERPLRAGDARREGPDRDERDHRSSVNVAAGRGRAARIVAQLSRQDYSCRTRSPHIVVSSHHRHSSQGRRDHSRTSLSRPDNAVSQTDRPQEHSGLEAQQAYASAASPST